MYSESEEMKQRKIKIIYKQSEQVDKFQLAMNQNHVSTALLLLTLLLILLLVVFLIFFSPFPAPLRPWGS